MLPAPAFQTVDTSVREDRGSSLSPQRRLRPRLCRAFALAACLLAPLPARAQDPSALPSPPPTLKQDDLDLQARSNVVQGSGARAFGMGGAFLARADDATAASWNPAGLSHLRRPEISVVWAAANAFKGVARDLASGAVLSDDDRKGNGPDFIAAALPFELRTVSGAVQLSFQRVISFDGDRTIVTPDRRSTVSTSGGFDVLALGTGLQVSRKIRVGGTLNRWFNGYDQTRVNLIRIGSNEQRLDFGFSGWNIHAGLIVSPWENLNLGVVAKTPFRGKVDLRRSRTDVDTRPDEADVVTTNAHSGEGTLEFPGAVGFGASWRPRSALTLSADYTRTFWSNGAIRNFFALQRTIGNQPPPEPEPFDKLPYPSLFDFSSQGQTDTQQIRGGAEYVLIWGRLKVPLRGGYFSDAQYFRRPDGRPPRFQGWTAGTGLIIGPILLDVAYVRQSGRYVGFANDNPDIVRQSVKAHRLYVSVIYRDPR